MVTSSTTLLDEINDVLLDIGEAEVRSSTENFVARKASKALQEGVRVLVTTNNQWDFLRSVLTATTWANEKATLDDSVIETHYILCNNKKVSYLQPDKFFLRNSQSYENANMYPRFYTRVGAYDYYFYPYPATLARQLEVKFYVTQYPTVPNNDNGNFGIPDHFMPLIRNWAKHSLALNHVNNPEMARNFKANFEQGVSLYRGKYVNTENSSRSVIST